MSMPLTIVTWFWGNKYSEEWIGKLGRALDRNLKIPFCFLVVRPQEDDPLVQMPGCFVRLKMFDPHWQWENGIRDKFVSIDLGVVITGNIDHLFKRSGFNILQGGNQSNPCPFNCGLMMIEPGFRPDVWTSFTPEAAAKVPYFDFPDDQSWIWHKIPDAKGWKVGPDHGIWSFKKRGWAYTSNELPAGARLVVFPGSRKPNQFAHLPWISENWK